MKRIGFEIGNEEEREDQIGIAESSPIDEEEASDMKRWLSVSGRELAALLIVLLT